VFLSLLCNQIAFRSLTKVTHCISHRTVQSVIFVEIKSSWILYVHLKMWYLEFTFEFLVQLINERHTKLMSSKYVIINSLSDPVFSKS